MKRHGWSAEYMARQDYDTATEHLRAADEAWVKAQERAEEWKALVAQQEALRRGEPARLERFRVDWPLLIGIGAYVTVVVGAVLWAVGWL